MSQRYTYPKNIPCEDVITEQQTDKAAYVSIEIQGMVSAESYIFPCLETNLQLAIFCELYVRNDIIAFPTLVVGTIPVHQLPCQDFRRYPRATHADSHE